MITEKLKSTFTYIDNATVCGLNQSDQDRRLKHPMVAIKKTFFQYLFWLFTCVHFVSFILSIILYSFLCIFLPQFIFLYSLIMHLETYFSLHLDFHMIFWFYSFS